MLIPKVMNGLEKSITFSRSAVIVSPATAKSAFWRERRAEMRIPSLGRGREGGTARPGPCAPGRWVSHPDGTGCVCCRARPGSGESSRSFPGDVHAHPACFTQAPQSITHLVLRTTLCISVAVGCSLPLPKPPLNTAAPFPSRQGCCYLQAP